MSEQKMREALELMARGAVMANRGNYTHMDTVEAYQRLAREALAAPAGEQVGLTDEELLEALYPLADNPSFPWTNFSRNERAYSLKKGRAVIAAHEAKRNGGAA